MRGSLLANLAWLPALAVGGLQMFGIDAGALTQWGADLFGPIALYVSMRTGGTVMNRFMKTPSSPLASAAIVVALCTAWEICQLFDFSGTPLAITAGRFDPIDLAAYAAGAAIGFGVELAWRRQQPSTAAIHP